MRRYSLGELLSYEQPTAYIVESTDYNDSYEIPVLTAGKTFILGYTNEKNGVYDNLPVIIFDDFTTASRYVNFKFKVKSSAMKILTPNTELVLPKYIYYLMQTIKIDNSTHKRYWIQQYSKIKVSIPSFSEQEQIVSRIEELFSELDKAAETLQTTKKQLAVYRQAVLKEAFDFSDYVKTELHTLTDKIGIGPFGTSLHKSDYIENGIPVINPQHIKNQKVVENPKVTITDKKAEELSTYRFMPNDIVMGRRGEMGRTASISNREKGWVCGTGSILIRLKPDYDANLYSQILSSPNTVRYLKDNSTGTTMDNLNEDIVKAIPVPVVTKMKQHVIFDKLEQRLSICDSIEKAVRTTLQQTEAMRQSILKKAFEEEL